MILHRNINIAKVELFKYIQLFTIVIISFVCFQAVIISLLESRRFLQSGNGDINFFKLINRNFSSFIFSAIPLTIILTISKEFSTGFALKLMSNGISRLSYFKSKYILAIVLTSLTIILYLIVFFLSSLFINVNFIDKTLLIRSLFFIIVVSFFVYAIVVSISLLIRNWQYSLLAYYGYFFIEFIIVYQFEQKTPLVNYLPMQLATTIVQFEKKFTNLNDIFLISSVLICFSVIVITTAYRSFKRSDL